MSVPIPPAWQGPMVTPSLDELKMFRDTPHSFLLDLVRTHGEVVWYGMGPFRFVIGTQPHHVQHVLVEGHRVYTKNTFQYKFLSHVTGDGLLTSDGEVWRSRRRIQQPAFQRSRLTLVSEATRQATDRMCKRWIDEGRTEVDVAAEMFRLSLDVVMDVLFGYPLDHRAPEIVKATEDVLHHLINRSRSIPGIPSWIRPIQHQRYLKALALIDEVIASTLKERRATPTDGTWRDLLDLLIQAEDEDRITPEGIRNEMITMIIAGHETVASALTWTWMLLAENPEIESTLIKEAHNVPDEAEGLAVVGALPFAKNTISEALRLYPPAWVVSRRSEPEDIPGTWLPNGTLVMLSPYVSHRMDAQWNDAAQFRPERFQATPEPGSYFPFGTGPRLCIGRDFALVEAVLVLSGVARRCRLRPTSYKKEAYAGVTLQPENGLKAEIIY